MTTAMDLRILLLEDDPSDASLIAGELTRHGLSFDMVRVETASELRDAIGSRHPHLILADYELPTLAGAQALQIARESAPGVPFILVSGVVGEDLAVECMRKGATDYVLKQRLSRLGPVVDRALGEVRNRAAMDGFSAQVAHQQQQIVDIMESMPIGFFTVDRGFRFAYLNGRAERILGRSRNELLGCFVFEALPGLEGTSLETALRTAARENLTVEVDYRHEPEHAWYEVQVIPAAQSDGAIAVYLRDVTDRRLVEEEHRRSQAMYKTLVEELPAATYLLETGSQGSRFLYMSPQIEGILGLPPQEWLDHHSLWKRSIHPDDRDAVLLSESQLLATGRTRESLYRILASDGTWKGIHEVAALLGEPTREPYLVQGVVVDITREAEAHEAARHRAAMLGAVAGAAGQLSRGASLDETIADVLPELASVISAQRAVIARCVSRNPGPAQWSLVAEWASPDLTPIRWGSVDWEVLGGGSPDWGEILVQDCEDYALVAQLLAGTGCRSLVAVPVRGRDAEEWGRLALMGIEPNPKWSTPELDALHTAANALGSAIGLSEQGRELRQTGEALKTLLESSPVAIVAADLDGKVTIWTPAAQRLYGWAPEEMVGSRPVFSIEEGPRTYNELLERVGRGEIIVGMEVPRVDKDGRPLEVSVSAAPVRDANGAISGVISVDVDLSSLKSAERQLRASLDRLHEVDSQRRGLLARLVRAQEDERRRIAVEIHDDSIQAMIAAQLRLEGLGRSSGGADAVRQLAALSDTIGAAISGLRELVFDLRPAALDQDGLPAALSQYLRYHASDSDTGWAVADLLAHQPSPDSRIILFRIAQEALANIRRHAGATRVDVEVRTEGQGTKVTIRDDGVGFAPTGDRNQPGHLGLDIMRERAELASGWLRIDSALDKGTVVEYWIPDSPEAGPRGD